MTKIPHRAVVFVGDGRKALFFRNEGNEKFPNLKVEAVFEDQNPAGHDQGSDRPGRVSKASQSGQRSAVEMTDWHELEERRFVKQVAAAAERIARGEPSTALIIVAPPRMLAALRSDFHPDVKLRIVAELAKDLTRHPVGDIEKHLRDE
ncbi:host attachment family protein [Bradyrhizobium barranii subsp. barranii]|uniref:Host attachment family protein n=1 Tax=Bradyrhizobium barranii subsp. barranii TaxID=2823807 RepID=A0A7Z0QE89_9BRAD|nr:host attachment family protein [Bradyrhizobium barranii]UGX91155.1 host attachment family protein [Bradyrhizobium barranii subsp. barranii]